MLLGLEMCVKWRLWMIEWILGCLLYESWKKTIIKIEISGPRGKIRVCHIRSNIGLILWHSAILCKKGADCHRKCHHVCPKHIPKPSLQNAPRPLEGTLHFIFFFNKKSCGPFLKSLLNLLQYCFCFMFCFFFWLRGMWDLSSPMRNQTTLLTLEGKLSNHWTTREVLVHFILKKQNRHWKTHAIGNCQHPRVTQGSRTWR